MHDRNLSFSDPAKDGNLSDAMICKFKLEKKSNSDDRPIAVIENCTHYIPRYFAF